MQNEPAPIDAVITWVDGDDPNWQAKRAKFADKSHEKGDTNSATRYKSMNEILYCVGSILKFSPFFRNIFIVTDEQTPPIFDRLREQFGDDINKVKIIDHQEIYREFEDELPVFNSSSIETMLFRISELAEKWVYFNDDFFLLRPTEPRDYFNEDLPILRAQWNDPNALVPKRLLNILRGKNLTKAKYVHYLGQIRANNLAGFQQKILSPDHAPYAFRKSTAQRFFDENTEVARQNAQYKFRSPQQYNVNTLFYALERKLHDSPISDEGLLYVKPSRQRDKLDYIKRKLREADSDENLLFMCIQELDQAPQDCQDYCLNWLEAKIFGHNSRIN